MRPVHSKAFPIVVALALLAVTGAGPAGAATGVDLQVSKSGAAVDLAWSGGVPTFEVYRSTDPATVLQPGQLLLETAGFSATDTPPPGQIWFYKTRGRSDCWRPIADAAVLEDAPATNVGGDPELLVTLGAAERYALLRFPFDAIPSHAVVDSATLLITRQSATGDSPYDVWSVKEPWIESAVTWNGRPDLSVVEASATQLAADGVHSWDLTALTQGWISGAEQNHGVAVRIKDPGSTVYFARESADENVPRLCITWHDPVVDTLAQLDEDSQSAPVTRFEGPDAVTVDAEVPHSAPTRFDAAIQFLQSYGELYALSDPLADLFLDRVRTWHGQTAFSFGRRVGNVPVFDETLLVLVDDTTVRGSSSALGRDRTFSGAQVYSAGAARAAVLTELGPEYINIGIGESPSLYWVPTVIGGDDLRLAWRVPLAGAPVAGGDPEFQAVFVDAETGSIVLRYGEVLEGDYPGEHFRTNNANRTESITCFAFPWDHRETWFDDNGAMPGYPGPPTDFASDGQVTDAEHHAIYHYFHDNFGGWESMNGSGNGFSSYVHSMRAGWDNARFNPFCGQMEYGDGWATADIVGHEFVHGLVMHSVPLIPIFGSGAINESLSDFFGTEIDAGDWMIAEERRDGGIDLDGDGTLDSCCTIRDMQNTTRDHLSKWDHTDIFDDSGGVHRNANIINKAFYLLTQGDTHNGYSTAGMGRAKARQLIFSVTVHHLHPWSTPVMLRDEMMREAQRFRRESLFGFTAQDVCDTINAFASIGAGAADTDCDGFANNPSGDGDGDSIPDGVDNCPLDTNTAQRDTDGDMIGDVCDPDLDGDGAANDVDTCPTVPNAGDGDADSDGRGDLCDDDDRDGRLDAIDDNCPTAYNPNQYDNDSDGSGDACDPDDDNDGDLDTADNCPFDFNPAQANTDSDSHGDACDNCDFVDNEGQENTDERWTNGDLLGDACDDDIDADGVTNDPPNDNCPYEPNAEQWDFDGDGTGTICDPTERAHFNGMSAAQQLSVYFEHVDLSGLVRVGIQPCVFGDCPDRLDESFNTSVTISLDHNYAARIVDDRGWVVDFVRDVGSGAATMNFPVDHEYFYVSSPGASPYSGRQYFLEMIAPPGSTPGQAVTGTIEVSSFAN